MATTWARKWAAISSSSAECYTVSLADDGATWGCSCPVWKFKRQECKHIQQRRAWMGTAREAVGEMQAVVRVQHVDTPPRSRGAAVDEDKAAKLRALADGIGPQIERLRGPRRENTPKRQRQGMSARCDANNLERVQRALLALAEGWERGTVPAELRGLTTKSAIEPLVTKRLESSGYYDIHESNEWRSEEPQAVALRSFVAEIEGGRHADRDAEAARRAKVKALEESIRFSDIDGFFPTPPALVERVIRWACIEPGMTVLEPSAGKGDLADAARAAGAIVQCSEVLHTLAELLKVKGFEGVQCVDFLAMDPPDGGGQFDRVVMNPPFERGADMAHVRRAFEWLRPGGRLVAVVSAGFSFRDDRQSVEFREWLEGLEAQGSENDPDAFKGVGVFRETGVRTWTLVIDKPE